MTSKTPAQQAWQQGHDLQLKQMEDALDALSTFQLDQSEYITFENDFILGFLRNFPAESLTRVMLPLLLRLSGRPLPSGRSREQLLAALAPQIRALSSSSAAQPPQASGAGPPTGPKPNARMALHRDHWQGGVAGRQSQYASANPKVATPSPRITMLPSHRGVPAAADPEHVGSSMFEEDTHDMTPDIANSGASSANQFSTPKFTNRVGRFSFPPSQRMPRGQELEHVLQQSTPWLLCPGKYSLYQTSQRFPTPTTGVRRMHTHRLVVYSCHCGNRSNIRKERFQLLVRVPIHPVPLTSSGRRGDCIPASREYEVFRRVDPVGQRVNEHAAAEGQEVCEEDGGITEYAKDFIKANFVPGMKWKAMLGKLRYHFSHTVSAGPNGFSDAAKMYFETLVQDHPRNATSSITTKNSINNGRLPSTRSTTLGPTKMERRTHKFEIRRYSRFDDSDEDDSFNSTDRLKRSELAGMNGGYSEDDEEEEDDDDEEYLSKENEALFKAASSRDPAGVQQALRMGADCDVVYDDWTPLAGASYEGCDPVVRILLDAGANTRWNNEDGQNAAFLACDAGHISTLEMLLNHDKGLLEISELTNGWTPLFDSIHHRRVDMVRFLLDRGASVLATNSTGGTVLISAASRIEGDLDIFRRILAAGVDVDARDKFQQTALHFAAGSGKTDVVRELILEHNAHMFAKDDIRRTPLDWAHKAGHSVVVAFLVEAYCNKMLQENGQLALHAILRAAKYTFAEPYDFHPPKNAVRFCSPLGQLTHTLFRTIVHFFSIELIHHRDDKGMLPIHIACETKAPVEFLSILVELDPATLYSADHRSGSLPIHWLLTVSSGKSLPEYDSVRYLVEQQPGGVGTLAARNNWGALPLHAAVLCRFSSGSGGSATGEELVMLRTVQFLIQSFPGSVSARTNAGKYPFIVAACNTSSASLNVVFELVRANPSLLKVRNAK